MAFLDFMKKKDKGLGDIDLDMPPEPPKMGIEGGSSTKGPIDEELMPPPGAKFMKAKKRKAPKIEEELPEIPPLPKLEEEKLPPLPDVHEEMPELPPLPDIHEEPKKKKISMPKIKGKGLFGMFKKKKVEEEMPPLPHEEMPELPPLPDVHGEPLPKEAEELPELPPLPEEKEEELPELPELPEIEEAPKVERKLPIPPTIGPFKAEPEEKHEVVEPVKEVVKETPVVKRKFVTIDEFRNVQSNINDARGVLKGIDAFLSEISEDKSAIDREFSEWNNCLKDIQKKILFVDKTLFEEQSI